MTIGLLVLLIVVGLILWLLPLTGNAARLNDLGKWTYIVALAVYLGLGR